ncbi:MAG: glycosyltransferase [Clostridia bacterium]|nr:glycosyltransferase [Clostridia bacterium]
MKIVEINTVHYGSTGKIMLQIADLAREQGHEAYTFSRAWSGQALPNEHHTFFGSYLENGIHRFVAPITGNECMYSKAGTKKLIKWLKEIEPDVVHLHNLHGFYINLPLLFGYLKTISARVIWTLHDCWSFTGHCSHFDMIGCEKYKSGCFDCPIYRAYPKSYFDNSKKMFQRKKEWFLGVKDLTIVTPSRWLADRVKESFLGEYPVKVINNGIDLDIFKPCISDFKKNHGIEDKYIVLGVAFGWGARKGLDVFVELSKRLGSSYQIVLVGTDDNVDKMLPENIISIHRTQNQRELAELYSVADVLANPTREDTYPTVNMEAIACGTPVVTFKTGGSPEIVGEGCGAVVPKNDISAFEEEIKKACQNGKNSSLRQIAENQFNKSDRFKDYINLYEGK